MEDTFAHFCEADIGRLLGRAGAATASQLHELQKASEEAADEEFAQLQRQADHETRAQSLNSAFRKRVTRFWKAAADAVLVEGFDPSLLSASATIEVLGRLLAKLCRADGAVENAYVQGGDVLASALTVVCPTARSEEAVSRVFPLLEWFSDEITVGRWRLMDPWSGSTNFLGLRPFVMASGFGCPALLAALTSRRGCPVQDVLVDGAEGSPLFISFVCGNIATFDWLLEQGVSPFTAYEDGVPVGLVIVRNFLVEGPDGDVLIPAFLEKRIIIITKLLAEYGLLEGWKDRYDQKWWCLIAEGLASIALSAYADITNNAEASHAIDLVLSTGFNWSWNKKNENALLNALYPDRVVCSPLPAAATLACLKRFHEAGFNVKSFHPPEDLFGEDESEEDENWDLCFCAAQSSHLEVLDYAIETLGCPVDIGGDGDCCGTPLESAIEWAQVSSACHLLRRHNALAKWSGEEASARGQPIHAVLLTRVLDDSDAEQIISALIERDPSFLDLPCYKRTPLAGSPIVRCVQSNRPRLLKLLLTSGLPNARELALRPVEAQSPLSPAALAAEKHHWECLELLLDHTDATVTDHLPGLPSLAEIAIRATHLPDPPSRALIAKIIARGKKEREEAEKAREAAQRTALEGSTTNAFEVPFASDTSSDAGGPPQSKSTLDEWEEREKKQKNRNKKKKKKKRSARKKSTLSDSAGAGLSSAVGGAGASGDDDDDDSSSGGSTDAERLEEPDDNLVDSRYAPSVDVMFAVMGLGPGGAPLRGKKE